MPSTALHTSRAGHASDSRLACAAQELGANAVLVSAALGLAGALAQALGPALVQGGRLLRPILAPVVQSLQSPCPGVRDAARQAAHRLCLHCAYPELKVRQACQCFARQISLWSLLQAASSRCIVHLLAMALHALIVTDLAASCMTPAADTLPSAVHRSQPSASPTH